ncbi:uncharacterized protein LOC110442289 [Mizuhopecten yessoensis]|uniref:uncharacterized protein LOC110442289 n=1 Tax=Mizuhopecten yessoensis TaxID=6573 RepID=UPI000B45E64B|nr:uncharacterized protein LOC110442289 [Mizuhopecten yessoensis]XP_021341491.1 uncharacterized protein LOC110442289 [Mizuhopecten yessoensis]
MKLKETEDCKLEANIESNLNEIRALKTQQDNAQKERVKSINTRREDLIKVVDEMADSFISDFENQSNCIKLQDEIEFISTKLENVRRRRKEVQRILKVKDDLAVVHDSGNLQDVVVHRKPYQQPVDIEFTHGEMNTHQLQLMFGGTAVTMKELATAQEAQGDNMTLSTNKCSDSVGTLIRQGGQLVLESTLNVLMLVQNLKKGH